MSDPTAPDQPAHPPVLTPNAAAAAPEPEPVPAPPEGPAPEPVAAAKGGAGWRAWVAAGAACGVVVVGGIVLTKDDGGDPVDATGQAGPSNQVQGRMRGAAGEITDIDGTTIRIESTGPEGDAGEVTIETDDDTTFTDVVDGDVGDLAVGDAVLVAGEVSDGAVTAESITEDDRSARPGGADGPVLRDGGAVPDGEVRVFPEGGPPEGFTPPEGAVLSRMTFGEITAIDGSTVTIDTPMSDDPIVVTVTDDTEVKVTEEIALDELEEGDQIQVTGDREDDVVQADSVRRGDGMMVLGGPATRVAAEASS